jgi:hypothetical protein
VVGGINIISFFERQGPVPAFSYSLAYSSKPSLLPCSSLTLPLTLPISHAHQLSLTREAKNQKTVREPKAPPPQNWEREKTPFPKKTKNAKSLKTMETKIFAIFLGVLKTGDTKNEKKHCLHLARIFDWPRNGQHQRKRERGL